MTIPFTAEQERLFEIFNPYMIYNKKSGPELSTDAPNEVFEAYKKCKQIAKEQREREIESMFY